MPNGLVQTVNKTIKNSGLTILKHNIAKQHDQRLHPMQMPLDCMAVGKKGRQDKRSIGVGFDLKSLG